MGIRLLFVSSVLISCAFGAEVRNPATVRQPLTKKRAEAASKARLVPTQLLAVGTAAIRRGDYRTGLTNFTAALSAAGADFRASHWAQAYYGAGFALDQLGHRSRSIEFYERALIWVEPHSALRSQLEQALVASPRRFMSTGRRSQWAAADRPVSLPEDRQRHRSVAGGADARFPFLLPDDRFQNLTAEEKQRLAEVHLETLRTAPGGEARWRAIETLGLLRERRALPYLQRFLLELGPAMGYRQCWVSARALYRIAAPETVPALVRATVCRNPQARAGASLALEKITGQRFRTPAEWQRWWAEQQRNPRPEQR